MSPTLINCINVSDVDRKWRDAGQGDDDDDNDKRLSMSPTSINFINFSEIDKSYQCLRRQNFG